MPTTYELEKKTWTETDFDIMGWHDSPIYGMALFSNPRTLFNELAFDIDYILQWIEPDSPGAPFSFWIAPATLIFNQVINLQVQSNHTPPFTFDFEIMDIHRLEESRYPNGTPYWKWHIELGNGNIHFESGGYEQIIKQPPLLTTRQEYPPETRENCNFNRDPF